MIQWWLYFLTQSKVRTYVHIHVYNMFTFTGLAEPMNHYRALGAFDHWVHTTTIPTHPMCLYTLRYRATVWSHAHSGCQSWQVSWTWEVCYAIAWWNAYPGGYCLRQTHWGNDRFAILGNINKHLTTFERSIHDGQPTGAQLAKTMMVFMVCGFLKRAFSSCMHTFHVLSSLVKCYFGKLLWG